MHSTRHLPFFTFCILWGPKLRLDGDVNADVGVSANFREGGGGGVGGDGLPVHISLVSRKSVPALRPRPESPLSSHMLNGNFAFNFKCYL